MARYPIEDRRFAGFCNEDPRTSGREEGRLNAIARRYRVSEDAISRHKMHVQTAIATAA